MSWLLHTVPLISRVSWFWPASIVTIFLVTRGLRDLSVVPVQLFPGEEMTFRQVTKAQTNPNLSLVCFPRPKPAFFSFSLAVVHNRNQGLNSYLFKKISSHFFMHSVSQLPRSWMHLYTPLSTFLPWIIAAQLLLHTTQKSCSSSPALASFLLKPHSSVSQDHAWKYYFWYQLCRF